MLVHSESSLESFHPRLKNNFGNLEFMLYMPRNPAIEIWSPTAHGVGRRNSRYEFGQITAYFTDPVDETTREPTIRPLWIVKFNASSPGKSRQMADSRICVHKQQMVADCHVSGI